MPPVMAAISAPCPPALTVCSKTCIRDAGFLMAETRGMSEQGAKKAGGSLYEQIGGEPAMGAAVELFYRRVLSDDRISHFFEDVDMERQAAKQKAFLTMVCGGPSAYSGKDMRKGHAHLVKQGLNDTHFNAVAEKIGRAP